MTQNVFMDVISESTKSNNELVIVKKSVDFATQIWSLCQLFLIREIIVCKPSTPSDFEKL